MSLVSAEEILKNQIIEKAWADPEFKKALLNDPKGALKQAFDIELPEAADVKVLDEAPGRYFLVIPPNPAEVLSADSDPNSVW
ncbi:NHLP leader peptide family RiPP precursor [Paenibacillus sp. UNC499MF]|uniref:NHLP leader peptide family RiPP precursor n=1 Tax=Paenibacillus sp. UNC499MF TaxID=1502751 RepID=UPI00215669D3|nr:NHLP leader peptide family RiPP precursor [Paenibacillus sp. UNC499MF]